MVIVTEENSSKIVEVDSKGDYKPIRAPEITAWDLEWKSFEELEKKLEEQKNVQMSLINRINEQWYRRKWEWEEVLNFDKNINLIYLKIKDMKKSS